MVIDILIGLFFLVAFGFGYVILIRIPQNKMQKRIERIQQRKLNAQKLVQDVSLRRKVDDTKGIGYYLSKPLPNFKKLGDRLTRAGKTMSPKQYLLNRLLAMLAIIGVCAVLGKSILLGIFVGIIVGVWLPLKWLDMNIAAQNKAFLLLFPDAIDLIVRGLRSGLPVSESIVLVAQEVQDPIKSVFSNIHNMMKLGVSLEKALQETARKLDMTEFNFFTTSIVLQRETGGNLSEILNNLSEVLRNRFMMRMKIKAMSSEARASSYIIGALPFVVLAAVSVLSPAYMRPLIDDYRGNIAAAIAAGMMFTGMWVMNRMTKFEI
jgi:tight adherence protein B